MNFLWVMLTGDKGGDPRLDACTQKYVVQVGGHEPHCAGLYAGADIHANQQIYFGDWPEQLDKMEELGVRVVDREGNMVVRKVRIFYGGDMQWLADIKGQASGASTYPSLWREELDSKHLRKSHLDGSEHSPRVPGCVFELRTGESTLRHYHDNLSSRRAGDMNKRGKFHCSVVRQPLFNVKNSLQLVPPSLHIGTWAGLFMWNAGDRLCAVADGNLAELDMAAVLEEMEEAREEEDDEEGPVGPVAAVETVKDATIDKNLQDKAEIERQWKEKDLEVITLEMEMKEVALEVAEKESLLKRIKLAQAGEVSGLELQTKAENKAQGKRASRKSAKFGHWKPVDSWACGCCLLSAYDQNILWRECQQCRRNVHVFCQLLPELDVDTMVICRSCSNTCSYEALKVEVEDSRAPLLARSRKLSKTLNIAKAKQSSLKQEVEQFMGAKQREYRRRTDEIGATKTEFFSNVFVGNHVDLIFKEFEYLIEVLDSWPHLQSGITEVVECYRSIHFLMQVRRFLTPAEQSSLKYECTRLGEIFPRVFKCSLPPKLDTLVFVVPMFAEKWGTVGGLREEGMERLHNLMNQV